MKTIASFIPKLCILPTKAFATGKSLTSTFVLLIACAVMAAAVCSCDGDGKLSGTYATDDGSMVYTFSGKKVTAEAFGQKGEATYELKDGNFIMTRPDGKTESYPYILEGNKFSFKWFGKEVVLTKK